MNEKCLLDLDDLAKVSGGVSEGGQTVTKQDISPQEQVPYGTVITVETTDMAQRAQ